MKKIKNRLLIKREQDYAAKKAEADKIYLAALKRNMSKMGVVERLKFIFGK